MKRATSWLCAVLLATTFSNAANAGGQWCEEDPEFLVNGSVVDVSTVFSTDPATVKSVSFDLLVPSNATAVAVSLPGTIAPTATISRVLPAYDGVGWMPVVVVVRVNASSTFTTTTTIAGTQGGLLSAASGQSNAPTRVQFALLAASLF